MTSKSASAMVVDRNASNGPTQINRNTYGSANATVTEQEIRELAYEIYEARGASAGNAVEDWEKAEQQLLGYKNSPSKNKR